MTIMKNCLVHLSVFENKGEQLIMSSIFIRDENNTKSDLEVAHLVERKQI